MTKHNAISYKFIKHNYKIRRKKNYKYMSEIIQSHNALPLLRWLPQYNFSWMSSSAWIVIGPEEGEDVNRGLQQHRQGVPQ